MTLLAWISISSSNYTILYIDCMFVHVYTGGGLVEIIWGQNTAHKVKPLFYAIIVLITPKSFPQKEIALNYLQAFFHLVVISVSYCSFHNNYSVTTHHPMPSLKYPSLWNVPIAFLSKALKQCNLNPYCRINHSLASNNGTYVCDSSNRLWSCQEQEICLLLSKYLPSA